MQKTEKQEQAERLIHKLIPEYAEQHIKLMYSDEYHAMEKAVAKIFNESNSLVELLQSLHTAPETVRYRHIEIFHLYPDLPATATAKLLEELDLVILDIALEFSSIFAPSDSYHDISEELDRRFRQFKDNPLFTAVKERFGVFWISMAITYAHRLIDFKEQLAFKQGWNVED